MFTGIIENLGKVTNLEKDNTNLHISIQTSPTHELKIDQSIAHNGVCLTVVDFPTSDSYTVTAIDETLKKSNIGDLQVGSLVNLERCLKMGDRLDGHMVQGHVDTT
ncbi:riboflavin synthase, partial [Arthrospira sp. PCC 8006]|uniref:riboflavin synthase n=1 Tax=Arthrospira sp. PCC 8006 TaxID=1982224 RepID=UPI00396EABF8